MKKKLFLLFVTSLLLVTFFLGCNSAPGEGFAIYLTRDNILPSQMEVLSHVDLNDHPIISMDDIVSYNWESHEIELTAAVFKELEEIGFPTYGASFVVCVDGQPLYWGAFWPGYSSQSFDGVTILIPSLGLGENIIALKLGYPSSSFFQGEDPRSNPIIYQSLEKAGKLK